MRLARSAKALCQQAVLPYCRIAVLPALVPCQQCGKLARRPMRTVAILSQKGGTGKTTISLHLAVAAQRDGQTAVVIDLDPQASSAGWKDSRADEEPIIVSTPASRLPLDETLS